MLDGQLLVTLDEDWKPEGQTNKIAQGSVIALDLASVEKDPVRLEPAVCCGRPHRSLNSGL